MTFGFPRDTNTDLLGESHVLCFSQPPIAFSSNCTDHLYSFFSDEDELKIKLVINSSHLQPQVYFGKFPILKQWDNGTIDKPTKPSKTQLSVYAAFEG